MQEPDEPKGVERGLRPNSKAKPKERRHSARKTVKEEYAILIAKLEAKICDLKSSDSCVTWILQHLHQTKAGSCFCKGFEDEAQALRECKQVFRDEIMLLKDEVDSFHNQCEDQRAVDQHEVIRNKRKCKRTVEKAKAEMKEKKKSLLNKKISDEELEFEKSYLERKQRLLDREEELLEREDALVHRRKQMEEFEKEIDEIERLLNRRQSLCDRKHEDLITLHEELKELRSELDLSQSETSERAHKNWEILRRNLQDRQKLLESNVQKYRTELASASATLTGKDIHIKRMQEQMTELQQVIEKKDQKIRQLESRLALALTECLKAERGVTHPWRRGRGVGRSESLCGDSATFSSTEESANSSPVRFSLRSASQRLKRQQISLNKNPSALSNGSCEKSDVNMNGKADSTKLTKAVIHHHNHVIGNGVITPTKGGNTNASSACMIM